MNLHHPPLQEFAMKMIPLMLLTLCTVSLVATAADDPAGHDMAMHEHMQKMQEQMAAVMKETGPAKKQELMQKHMEAMQAGMEMMQKMMGQMMQHEGAAATTGSAADEHAQHGK
jgi:hypothetical protein